MKKFIALLAFACLYWHPNLFAQQRPEPIYVGPDAPAWVALLNADHPNVFEIQKAYADYYRERPFVKNTYTQHYKHWMHWARPYTQGDGSLHLPTPEEMRAHEMAVRATREGVQERGPTSTGWSFVAPVRTTDVDGVTPVTWQTNIYSLDIAPSNSSILYAGGESGGLWKTTDKGLNWTLLTAGITHGAFGAVKIHPTDPNTVYACTSGKIVKTTDGGLTWTTVYLESSLWVNELAISTADPNVVLAASDQGLLRSTNGGTNWAKLHNNQTWAVKFKVGDPTTVYNARKNGSNFQFQRSTDSGASFSTVGTGWYALGSGESVTGVHIAVCPSNASKLYAYLCGEGGMLEGYIGVFVSNDGGTTWANTNPSSLVGNSPTAYSIPGHTNLMDASGTVWFNQGFYDMAIVVNPTNDQQLIAGGCSWFKSNDGGATWSGLGGYVGTLSWAHPDIQALAASGTDLWIASDGGLDYSNNWASTATARMNGITGSDMWGFDAGWNEDLLVGGRYHNGNMAWSETFGTDVSYRLGGAESPTGYVNPGPGRRTYFSDIGGKSITGGLTGGITDFAFGFEPNESYAYYANSELVWHPQCWNIVFAGKDNVLWKSTDGGSSFSALYTFPGAVSRKVYDIEISRSNPQVMYCSQWNGTDDAIWRSSDGGQTWALCAALPTPNNNDRLKLAVAAEDANVLWVGITYGDDGKKVYKTTDGGQTWINLTTATLNGFRVTNVMAQYGTDGGIYAGTDGGVFYRNNTHSDWQPYSVGLPLSAETNRLKPFYRDGKIRNGCWGFGIWEAPLFEASTVIPQAMASALQSNCTRDTIYFDDYSVLQHAGVTWSWSFSPTPAYVSATDVRNPKVVFGAVGNYTATMTLNGALQSTLQISVANGCEPDSIPDRAAIFGGNDNQGSVVMPTLDLITNTFSVTAWIKPDGIQPDYSSIFMSDGSEAAGFNFREGNNTLGYHWPGGHYWWDSNLSVPPGEWSHVAFVVDGTTAPRTVSFYLNGVKSTHFISSLTPAYFNSTAQLGTYRGWSDRNFKGEMDEVTVWNKVLTQQEIREMMHLPHVPANEPGLIGYYQFNEPSGPVLDRANIRHGGLSGSAARVTSSCPMGPGNSARLSVNGSGAQTFGNTGLTLTFPASGPYPAGELVATRINWTPHLPPGTSDPLSPCYWVVHNFGTNTTFNTLSSVKFDRIGFVPNTSTPGEYRFYKRGSNAFGNTWGSPVDVADALDFGTNGSATFSTGNGINTFSQFIVAKPASALPVEWLSFEAKTVDNQKVKLDWATGSESKSSHFVVERSADGRTFEALGQVAAAGLSSTRRDYIFWDEKPLAGRSYYRLRQVDTDGAEALSSIRAVYFDGGAAPEVNVFPNPIAHDGTLQVRAATNEPCVLRLYDEKGRSIRVLPFTGHGSVSLQGLAAGVYPYQITSERYLWRGRVVVR